MAGITQWIKKTVTGLWDPEKDQRLQNLVQVLQRGIRAERQSFSLDVAVHGLDFTASDLEEAKEHVYRSFFGARLGRRQSDAQGTRNLAVDCRAA